MARRTLMTTFARWHIRLGWIAAIPILLWLVTGLVMAARPIGVVRGEDLRLRRADTPLALPDGWRAQLPPLREARLISQRGRTVMMATVAGGAVRRFLVGDAGFAPLPPVDEAEARAAVRTAIRGGDTVVAMRLFPADAAPLDLRKPVAAWQVTLADGTHVYVGRDSGEIEAVRTRWWRFYDVMWGLHIADPVGRENTSNGWLWSLGGVSLASAIAGSVLLFRRRRRRPA